jgi:hypothetical protein
MTYIWKEERIYTVIQLQVRGCRRRRKKKEGRKKSMEKARGRVVAGVD